MDALAMMDIGRDALWLTVKVTFPIMLTGTLFGVLMSILQSVTQIQENALSFIPKMLAIIVAVLLFTPFIGNNLLEFANRLFDMISTID